MRLAVLVVYTQFVVHHLLQSSTDDTSQPWLLHITSLQGLSLTRLVQLVLINGSYIWYLQYGGEQDEL